MTSASRVRRPVDLVVASAGTGKTARLIAEIRGAIDGGTPASSILATTFTNKAAGELVERARAGLITDGRANEATDLLAARVGTINATFGKIVGEFALEAGRSPVADVVSELRQKRIFAISAEAAIAGRASTMFPHCPAARDRGLAGPGAGVVGSGAPERHRACRLGRARRAILGGPSRHPARPAGSRGRRPRAATPRGARGGPGRPRGRDRPDQHNGARQGRQSGKPSPSSTRAGSCHGRGGPR